jgi:capsular polysaccharide biosynthesis protein
MTAVFQTTEIESSLQWNADSDVFVGGRIHPVIARRYAKHRLSLPAQHVTARQVIFDPTTGMVFHEGAPLPWSCFFGPHDPRVSNDCATADARARNGCLILKGRRVYCGFNRHYQNYAHWITQCVPAIAGYTVEPEFADGILLLPPLPASYENALSLAGIRLPEIVRVDPNRGVAAEELVYSSLLSHHYAPSRLARGVFARMAQSVRAMQGPNTPLLHERIYVSRADSAARPMTNEPQLSARLAELGIKSIVPGAMTIEEQVRQFDAARLVVGPHGAGLGNIVFCQPKSLMYELMPEHWPGSFVGPSINLFAQTAGMHYCVETHTVHGTWAEYRHNVPWTVDIETTLNRLSELIRAYDC